MKFILVVLTPLWLAVSCAPTTPKARIEEYPGRFSRLSERDKDLAQQGQITRGMTMEGVWLAWGEPSARYYGARSGKPTERWDYSRQAPTYTVTTGFGFGFGSFDRHGYNGCGVGIGPRLDYGPEYRASVLFVNRRVESWERKH